MLDFRSDTVTRPTTEMRTAAAEAEVGDAVYGEDPTVNELEATAADVLGTEDALYVPSGTMGNQLAVRVHTDRDQEVLVERSSHCYRGDSRGFSQTTSLQVETFDGGPRGVPPAETIRDRLVGPETHKPSTGLLCLENTHSVKGGVAVRPDRIAEAAGVATAAGLPVHLDGSRLFNAAVALDCSPTDVTEHVDSVMVCLSKGLGAPVGSVLAGDEPFVAAARTAAKRLGGGMRQAGIVAAPGLVALENVDRLAEDHALASRLADRIRSETALTCPEPETNIVHVDTSATGVSASEFVAACRNEGVAAGERHTQVVRLCTHRDLDGRDVDEAVERIGTVLDETS